MLYLLEHNIDKFCQILSSFKEKIGDICSRLGFKCIDDLYQCLYDKNQIEFLINCTSFLENHGIYEPYVQKEMWRFLACRKQYGLIDWNNWMEKDSKTAMCYAVKAGNWDFPVKYKSHWILLKHFRLCRFIKSFF